MDIAKGVCVKLNQILSKLKLMKIISSFTYEVDFEKVDEDDRECLMQIDDLLGQCLEKLSCKPKRAEIRNVIGELMRKKNIEQNLNDSEEGNSNKKEAKSRRRSKSSKHSVPKEKTYLCEFCGRRFSHYTRLKTHIFRTHTNENFESEKEYDLNPSDESETPLNIQYEDNEQCNFCSEAKYLSREFNVSGGSCPYHKTSNTRERDDIYREIAEEYNVVPSRESASDEEYRVMRAREGISDEETEEEQYKSFNCSVCHKSFRLERSLGKHFRLKHSCELQINFTCSKCKKNFRERGKLNRHLLIHKGGQYQCFECGKSFHRMDNLRRHFSLIHQQIKTFDCKYCHKGFSLKFNRDVHEKNVHEIGTEIECELCGKKCKNKTTYNEHKKLHEKSPLSCSFCSKKFMRKLQYRSHLKNKHKGVSPFQQLFDSVAQTASDSSV